MKRKVQYALCFAAGAAGYPLLEIGWRGRTHWSMAVAGGLGACYLGLLSQKALPPTQCALLGGLGITGIEYAIGRSLNRDHAIWDYSRLNFVYTYIKPNR